MADEEIFANGSKTPHRIPEGGEIRHRLNVTAPASFKIEIESTFFGIEIGVQRELPSKNIIADFTRDSVINCTLESGVYVIIVRTQNGQSLSYSIKVSKV